jgi:sugar lactone lactonase YvrE
MLIVADAQTRFSWSFQIAKDGTLINGEPFYRVDMPELSQASGVAGVTVDNIGQVYFATALGIQYCEQNGRCAGIVSKPERGAISNIAFAGKDLNWLYVAEGNKLYRRSVKVKGVTAWMPVKAPKPPT